MTGTARERALLADAGRDLGFEGDALERFVDAAARAADEVEKEQARLEALAKMPTAVQVLACPMEPNDSGATTVGGYLRELLRAVWVEQEGFSGKRPFGNSSWDSDIEAALIRAQLVKGSLDSDGFVEHVDGGAVRQLVLTAIDYALVDRRPS